MKILLFNLGSIEHRIISWDVEGYRTLFANDIILWGPIPDKEFSLFGKSIPIISFSGPVSIKDIFKQLPEGWIPDIVTCDTSVLIYVQDIYLCPVKTILFTRDAWADTIFNRGLVELFDFVSHSIVDIRSYDNLKSTLLPLASFPVSLPDPDMAMPEFKERDIDVIAIANYNEGFYHERYRTLYKLAASNKNKLKILYYSGLRRKEIHQYYRRSKIVFDWAHTLSNRSYEAALNGCLLFSHEDNTAMSSFWEPWQEYVPYNDANVYDLIVDYITNPLKADEIIRKTGEKIKTIPVSFGQYTLENINVALSSKTDIQKRINHASGLDSGELNFRSATPFAYNYRYGTSFPEHWKELYFERIDRIITFSAGEDNLICPLIEAARLAFLTKDFDRSIKYLSKLENILPEYAWIYYLKGRIYFARKDHALALSSLDRVNDCIAEAPGIVQEYILPFIEKDLNCDGRRITDYLWQSVYGHKNEFQVRAILYLSSDLKGDIYSDLNDIVKAREAYKIAIGYLPAADCVKKAIPLFVRSNDFKTLLEITGKGTEDSPFDNTLVLYKAGALMLLGDKYKAFNVLQTHRKALRSFQETRKIELLKKILTLPAIIGFISKRAGMKVIQILIDNLVK